MRQMNRWIVSCTTGLIVCAAVGCGGSPKSKLLSPGTYALTVTSVNPVSGLPLGVSPADLDGAGGSGSPAPVTDLSLIYDPGTAVTLTAPAANSAASPFVSWVGCDSTTGYVCKVTMSKSKSVTVEYAGVSSISINPATVSVSAGGTVQIPATVNGFGTCSAAGYPSQPCAGSPVTYSLYLPSGVTGSLGTVSPAGVYTPASSSPASSVDVTVQSVFAPSVTAVGQIQIQQ